MFKYIVFNGDILEINLKCFFTFLECDICYCVSWNYLCSIIRNKIMKKINVIILLATISISASSYGQDTLSISKANLWQKSPIKFTN
jgi:hypothetical protein